MSSILKVNTIQDTDGNNIINENANVITIGASGDTITVPAGATVSGFTSAGIDDNATSTAITISSDEDVTFTEDILLGDDKKAIFGAGSDLQIYHDGANSYISEVGSGNLFVNTNGTKIALISDLSSSNGKMAEFTKDGAVELYYDNSKKFETTSGGVSVTGDLTVDTNTLFVDSSNNRVGIGTTSVDTNLHIESSSGSATVRVEASSSEKGDLQANSGNITLRTIGSYPLVFNTNQTERARIDTSGNLLVGKTASNTATAGIELRATNQVTITRSGNTPLILNRLSSDGEVVKFQKDGTNFGSIGVLNSDNPFFQGTATNHGGLQCGTNTILPCKSSANADNTLDLGQSDIRWKDIYLSGGAFIGGTGTANKLDDYEEGTWTPSFSGGFTGTTTYSIQKGTYTKIGRNVFFTVHMATTSASVDATRIDISTLPFTPSNATNISAGGASWSYANTGVINSTTTNLPVLHIITNITNVKLYKTSGVDFNGTDLNNPSGLDFLFNGQYITD
jgi:hypothetical protein